MKSRYVKHAASATGARQSKRVRITAAQIDTPTEASQIIVDPPHDDAKAWAQINGRRLDLIEKQLAHELSAGERTLLNDLNAAMVRHVDAIAPLPWGTLDKIRDAAQKLGIPINYLQ